MYTVTLGKTDKGYQFISNIDDADDYDPYAIHEIRSDKITVNGAEKTYKDANVILSVPASWLALEQHFEDRSNYYFKEPTLDRCQLTFYTTEAQHAIHRTEAEYLALLTDGKLQNVKILSYGKEKVSGFDCTKVEYSYTIDGNAYIAIRYDNVITGMCMYQFSVIYPAAEKENVAPVFAAIMDSVLLQPY